MITTKWLHATSVDRIQLLIDTNPQRAIQLLEKKLIQLPDNQYAYQLSMAYTNFGQYVKSDSVIVELLKKKNFGNDSALYMRVLLLNATNKKVLNRYEDAFMSLDKMHEYYLRNRNDSGLLEVYLAFVEYYRAANNFSYGLTYVEKTNALINSMTPKPPVIYTMRMLHRKAAILAEQSVRNDSVINLSQEVIRLGILYNEPKQVAIASNELGFYLYNQRQRPDLAEKYLKLAYRIWDSLHYPIYVTNASFNLAKLYAKTERYEEALRLADKGLKLVEINKWQREKGFWYELLAYLHKEKKQYKQAYEYENKAKEILTQYAYEQFKERLAYYSNQLHLKEKDDEVNRTHIELENKLHENKLLLSLLVAVCILLIIAVGGMLIITRQKRIMIKQQNEISQINDELKKLLSLKDVLLKEINHRVKNNLSMLSSLLYLKEKKLTNIETIETLREMRGRIRSVSLIHETLYQHETHAKVHFHDYLLQLSDQIKDIYEGTHDQHVAIKIDCAGLWLEISKAVSLAMILNELITNSYKHAFTNCTNPQITITYNTTNSVLEYADNGPGYDTSIQASDHGTSLVSIFAKQINAEITYFKSDVFFTTHILLKNVTG